MITMRHLRGYAETNPLPYGTTTEMDKLFTVYLVSSLCSQCAHHRKGNSIRTPGDVKVGLLEPHVVSENNGVHPQANRLTKRVYKIIGGMLSMYVDVEHRIRKTILPYVTFANNTAVH